MAAPSVDLLDAAMLLDEIEEDCPYLPGRISKLRLGNGFVAGQYYRELLDVGYRRSGHCLYRPICDGCGACEVIRVPVESFRKSKEQRRIWNRGGQVFQVRFSKPRYTKEKFAVYERYLDYQHAGGVGERDEERYQAFLVNSFLGSGTAELQLWAGERLAGIGILDGIRDTLSTVYFNFEPDFARYSPGTYTVLYEIELARRWGLKYYYLGHYIHDCPSMNYKARFRPCEIKATGDGPWRRLER